MPTSSDDKQIGAYSIGLNITGEPEPKCFLWWAEVAMLSEADGTSEVFGQDFN